MKNRQFRWDTNKFKSNLNKHGISFKEAATVFEDKNAIYFDDYSHSHDEDRFIIIGCSDQDKLLMVCHCYRDEGDTIRIISARRANSTEKELYGGNL